MMRPSRAKLESSVQDNLEQTMDVESLRAIARGDEQSLAALYDRYSRILFSLAQRILNDREEAEDVLQEVFLQVWKTASSFDEKRGRPFTWLAVMTRSRAIDRLRSQASRRRVIDESGEMVPFQDDASGGLRAVEHSERRETVSAALRQLPEAQRRTLLLAYFEGLSQTEIAERTGTPLGTIKTRMRSAMIRLRELLPGETGIN
jgi:RNA polymerase sigma-70 factor (ECF subfamily)